MADPAGHLARLRRADSQAKAARVLAALDAMAAAGEPPGISRLARRARVSRRFIYDHPNCAPRSRTGPRRSPASTPERSPPAPR